MIDAMRREEVVTVEQLCAHMHMSNVEIGTRLRSPPIGSHTWDTSLRCDTQRNTQGIGIANKRVLAGGNERFQYGARKQMRQVRME